MDENVEEWIIKRIALGMVLYTQSEGVIAKPRLLDHIVVRAPGLDFQPGTEFVERLVMRAVDAGNLNGRTICIPQRLDVFEFEFVVIRNVEMERAAERDIEHLQPPADGEERKPLLNGATRGGEFPSIAHGVGIFDQARIGNRLAQKFAGNIAASGKEQAVNRLGRRFGSRVPKVDVGIGTKDPVKEGLIAFPDPCSDIFQPNSVTRKGNLRSILLEGLKKGPVTNLRQSRRLGVVNRSKRLFCAGSRLKAALVTR